MHERHLYIKVNEFFLFCPLRKQENISSETPI
jgi:hypothetical protein